MWYVRDVVDANNAAGGDGRSSNAFEALASAATPTSNADDYIYVFEGNTAATPQVGGIALDNGQKLWGQGVDLDVPLYPDLVLATNQARVRTTAASANTVNVPATAGARQNVEIRGPTSSHPAPLERNRRHRPAPTRSADHHKHHSRRHAEGIASTRGHSTASTLALSDNNLTANGTAAAVDRTAGTLTITAFHDNVVTGASIGGIAVTGTGAAVVFDASATAGIQPVPGGTTLIGVSGNGIGIGGLSLTNVTGGLNFANAASGSIAAGDLDIFTDGAAALSASGSGGFDLDITTNAGVLVANAGPAAVLSSLDPALCSTPSPAPTAAPPRVATGVTGTLLGRRRAAPSPTPTRPISSSTPPPPRSPTTAPSPRRRRTAGSGQRLGARSRASRRHHRRQ